ncbi:hypothetical protein ACN27G_06075 [Plantactinospora sp. WMMB334]|uniref:hypothetical protein n=1 Tax=Plantactinospora sp. WMMB334 TaxID=3404119 RepID=UPI003B954093
MADQAPTRGPATVHAVRDLVDRLRESIGWLWLLVVPGPERRPGRAVDEDRAELLEAWAWQARAYRDAALREGRGALTAAAAPARLDVVDAQQVVHRLVSRAVARVARARGSCYVGDRSDVAGAVADALDWLTVGGPGRPWVVEPDGTVWRAGVVDELHDNRDAWVLADVARLLRGADVVARSAAGVVGEQVRPVEHRCPACGHRSLQLHHDGPTRGWTVTCVRRSCVCVGAGCGCLRRLKREGLPHVWTRSELSGAYGLAAAVDRARLAGRRRVGSGAAGHGGWSDRRRR